MSNPFDALATKRPVSNNPFDELASKQEANPFDALAIKGPSIGGAAKQFLIGAANSATMGIPEYVFKKDFDKQASPFPEEQIARGVGTTLGLAVGVPSAVAKIGTRIALKGLGKAAPKILRLANVADRAKEGSDLLKAAEKAKVVKGVVEGSGAVGLFNAVDPNIPLEEKPKAVLEGMALGAVMGGALGGVPYAYRKFIKKPNVAVQKIIEPPKVLDEAGQEIKTGRENLVPSFQKVIPPESKSIIDEIEKQQTKILAADRGIVPIKDQIEASKNIDVRPLYDNWKQGSVANTEQTWAMTQDFIKRLGDVAEGKLKSEDLVNDVIKADAMISEAARTVGARNRVLMVAKDQFDFLKKQIELLPPDAKEAASRLLGNIKTPNLWDKFFEFRTAGLLSSPFTHERNIVGNMIGRLFSAPEKTIAGGVNTIESFFTNKPRERFIREGYADLLGTVRGFNPALKNAINALKDENFISDSRLTEAVRFNKAIQGKFGKIVRTPFRFLNAADEFFATLSNSSSLYTQATRQAIKEGAKDVSGRIAELVKNPTAEMVANAAKESLIETYRQPLGKIGKLGERILNADTKTSRAIKFVIPFFKTPVNLFKWSIQRTPLGVVNPSIFKGTSSERAEAISKMAFGQVISAGMALQVMNGNITGKLSGDKAKREALMRQGIQPYSIKIGDKWISYRSYEPISSWLALVANTVESVKEKKNIGVQEVGSILGETAKMIKDQTFLQGISDVLNGIDDPERYGNVVIQNGATSLIPTGVGYISRLYDPIIREPSTIPEAIKSRLPYFSKGLPPKLDVWGRPITKEGTLMQRALLPSGVMTSKPDLTEEELVSLEKFPEKIAKTYRGIPLSVPERNMVTEVEGGLIKEYLDKIIATPQYKQLQPQQQSQIIDNVFSKIRTAVRTPFFRKKVLEEFRSLQTYDQKIEFIEKVTRKKLTKD